MRMRGIIASRRCASCSASGTALPGSGRSTGARQSARRPRVALGQDAAQSASAGRRVRDHVRPASVPGRSATELSSDGCRLRRGDQTGRQRGRMRNARHIHPPNAALLRKCARTRRFVKSAADPPIRLDNDFAPFLPEGHRCIRRHLTTPGSVERPQGRDSREGAGVALPALELQGFDQGRRELAQRLIPIRSGNERIFSRGSGNGDNLGPGAQKGCPSDVVVEHGEGIGVGFDRAG